MSSSQPPEYPIWYPPLYHVTSTVPPLLSNITLSNGPSIPNNFPRVAKWCGDGSSLLVQCEDRSFQTLTTLDESGHSLSPPPYLEHAKTFPQPSPIVDYVWYPGASQRNLPAFCFVASIRDCPVKLLDAKDGRLRASYPIVDHRERHIAPHSLAFNLSGERLYCGFEDAIEIFDIQRPGEGERLLTTPSKKSKDGLKGIISTLAFSYSPEYYAAGSLTPASYVSDNIALLTESAHGPVLSIGGVAEWEKGGVTQLLFNPSRPHILYAAFRRSERLWSWDLRGDTSVPICCFSRGTGSNGSGSKNLTNQKMRFDVESTGRWLASGNQIGEIAMYDLEIGSGEMNEEEVGSETRQTRPTLLYEAHGDSVGAVAFHPLEAKLLSISGSRQFDDLAAESNIMVGSESDSDSTDEARGNVVVARRMKERLQPPVRDASIKVWDFSEPVGHK